jgi:hypothetical protein
MIMWLDHKIFGSGRGMRSPFYDDQFYWLADDLKPRGRGNGELYTYMGGLGAQLHSVQWTTPKPGERRRLCNRDFVPFNVSRRWGRVMVAWAWTQLPDELDAAHAALRVLRDELGRVL